MVNRAMVNKEWHAALVVPKNAKLDQRIAWHLEHEKQYGRRKMPGRSEPRSPDAVGEARNAGTTSPRPQFNPKSFWVSRPSPSTER
jgi:hypothetical protein